MTRMLYALAVLLVLLGGTVRLAGSSVRPPSLPPPQPSDSPPTDREKAATLLSFQGIARVNPFAPERTAPSARWLPPALRQPEPAAVGPSAAPVRLRVFGTAVTAADAVALIDADPAIPGAEIYRVGDRIPGGRIRDIDAASVTIVGAEGLRVLRIETQAGGR